MKTRRLKVDINVKCCRSFVFNPTVHINHFKRRLIRLINKTKCEVDFEFYININNIVYEKIKMKIRLGNGWNSRRL